MIKFEIIRRNKKTTKTKVCWDCGALLGKYRFEITDDKKGRCAVCPVCVLTTYLNNRNPYAAGNKAKSIYSKLVGTKLAQYDIAEIQRPTKDTPDELR